MNAEASRLLALVLLLALALIGVLLPLFVRNNPNVLSLGNCFSSGVLLSAGVVHMMPSAALTCKIVSEDAPIASFIFGVGFFGVFAAEVLAVHLSGAKKQGYSRVGKVQSDTDGEEANSIEMSSVSPVVRRKKPEPEDEEEGNTTEEPTEEHSAIEVVGREGMTLFTSLVLLAILSFHSVMDGLVIGVGTTFPFKLFLAVFLHKVFAAFALGTSLLKSNMFEKQRQLYVASVAAFCLSTPLGIILGMQAGSALGGFGECLFVALASGTFVYVSLLELLAKEMDHHRLGVAKLASTAAGFVFMSALGLLED